ncbi:MAG: PAS domain S-box protein [Caldithrix sp.]|nr:PAS domain S-box protein [Caldithrix sp.]
MEKQLSVIIVHDQADTCNLFETRLRESYKLTSYRIDTMEAFRRQIEHSKVDVILCSSELKGLKSTDVLNIMNRTNPYCPVLIVADDMDEETAVYFMKNGADDYLSMTNISRLNPAVIMAIHRKQERMQKDIAAQALREKELRLRTTLNSIGDAVIATDTDSRIVGLNPVAEELTGWPEEEAVGKNLEKVFNIINEETRLTVESPVEKVLQQGSVVGLANHTILIDRKGNERPIADSGAPIKNEHGKVSGVVLVFRDQTEERKAQKALLESEKKIRKLFENMTSGFALYEMIPDAEGKAVDYRYLDINRAFEDMTGIGKQMIGKKVTEVFPRIENDPMNWIRMGGELVLEGQAYRIEHYSKPLDKWFSISSYVPQRGKLATMLEDITGRKKTEFALQESEQKYRMIIDESPIGIFYYDAEGIITECNKKFVEIIGSSREVLIGLNMLRQLKDKKLISGVRKSLKNGYAYYEGLYESVTSDKKTYVRVIFTGIRDEQGTIIAGLGMVEDIHKRKLAEHALQESEQRFRSLVQNAPDAIFVQTSEKFAFLNKACVRLLGAEHADEIIGQKILKRFHPAYHEVVTERMHRLNNKEEAVELNEEVMLTLDGNPVPVEVTAVPFKFEEKNGALAFVRDVRHRKTLEEQLRQSQKMEAVGKLAGGVAHDFNNLLTVISGYSDLLLGQLDEKDPTFDKLQQIKKAGNRAASLTNQLLAFSRKQVLKPEILNVNHLINNTQKMLHRLIGENIELETRLHTDSAIIEADPGQMEQIIINMAVNARDAMPDGGKLTIETDIVYLDETYVQQHENIQIGDYVLMSISDNGFGMETQTKERIFEPFFTTKEVGKGTGLGLSTVYGIVKQSGGHIWVDSEKDKGTTFKIYLPAKQESNRSTLDKATPKTQLKGDETILIVEDENDVADLVKQSLEIYGYHLLTAKDGQEALKKVQKRNNEIDLLLSDVIMPNMSGKELSQKIKKILPDLKVCFMSGYNDEAIFKSGLLEKGVHLIQKPFSPQALAEKVREVLDQKE